MRIADDTVSCAGGADGNVVLQLDNSLTSPTVIWPTDPVQTGLTANGLSAGTYFVLIQDGSLDCPEVAIEIVVHEKPMLTVDSSTQINNVSCTGGDDGNISLLVLGGTLPYEYQWSTNENGSDISGLTIGNYTVTITDDEGCSLVENFLIQEPLPLDLNADISEYGMFNISCSGETDGSIDLSIIGGTRPYIYNWSDGDTLDIRDSLPKGNYSVTVMDDNGCTDSIRLELIGPEPLNVQSDNIPTTCYESQDGGIFITSVNGGISPYGWSWQEEGPYVSIDTIPILFDNQYRGLKTLYFQDALGCVQMEEIFIESPDSLFVDVLPGDTLLTLGEDLGVSFQTNAETIVDFQWISNGSLECDTCFYFEYQPLDLTTFELKITDGNGCRAYGRGLVRVDVTDFIYIPNIFSPNGDGYNDILDIYGNSSAIKLIHSFSIYDRWGNQVFLNETFLPNEFGIGWNGNFNEKKSMSGVYVYLLEVEYINGEREYLSGNLTLVR